MAVAFAFCSIGPIRKRASTGRGHSYGTLSPIYAIESRIMES